MMPLTPAMLLVALLITTPTALDALNGTTSTADALQRYVVVTVIIWAATSLTHSLFIPPTNERQNLNRTPFDSSIGDTPSHPGSPEAPPQNPTPGVPPATPGQ